MQVLAVRHHRPSVGCIGIEEVAISGYRWRSSPATGPCSTARHAQVGSKRGAQLHILGLGKIAVTRVSALHDRLGPLSRRSPVDN